jgi:hypothetical protein
MSILSVFEKPLGYTALAIAEVLFVFNLGERHELLSLLVTLAHSRQPHASFAYLLLACSQ